MLNVFGPYFERRRSFFLALAGISAYFQKAKSRFITILTTCERETNGEDSLVFALASRNGAKTASPVHVRRPYMCARAARVSKRRSGNE